MSNRKANLDDGCNPELVAGAEFDGFLDIPVIKAPQRLIVPDGMTPFSVRHRATETNDAVVFFEKDPEFAEVLINPADYIEDFSRFKAIVSIDCSLYRNAPLAVQVTNLYRNRALGSYYQRHGSYVIPLIRWGNEYTYTTKYFPEKIAFLGAPKHSIVCIGSYGCSNSKEDKYYLHAGLDAMMEELDPKIVLVYGSMNDKIFSEYLKYAKFVQYPDWTTRAHGGDR